MKVLRRCYDWILGWAESPYGGAALFMLAFAEASVLSIPPGILLVPMCLGRRNRAFRFAAICTAGSVLGSLGGYAIGALAWALVGEYALQHVPGFSPEDFARAGRLYETWSFWVVFTAAFLPLPYKVVTITAGMFSVNIPLFILASLVGRGARFFLLAALLYRYGDALRIYIDRRFNMLVAVLALLVIGVLVALHFAGG